MLPEPLSLHASPVTSSLHVLSAAIAIRTPVPKHDQFATVRRSESVRATAQVGESARALVCSSQFFITTVKTTWLDGRHVVFGKGAEPARLCAPAHSAAHFYGSHFPLTAVRLHAAHAIALCVLHRSGAVL